MAMRHSSWLPYTPISKSSCLYVLNLVSEGGVPPPRPRELPAHYSPICQSGWRPPQTAGLIAGSLSLANL